MDQLLYTSVPPEGNVGFSWISFQSWAVYFLAGCTVRGGIKAFIAYAIGIAASIVIMVLGGAMTPALGFFAVPVAVGVIVFCAIFCERSEWLSFGLLFGYITICLRSAYEKKVSEDAE